MAIKFERLQTGRTYYERHREKMGNTTMSKLGEWSVHIKEIDAVKETALVSWNGNRPEKWHRRELERLFDWSMYDSREAEMTRGGFGNAVLRVRRKTKAERAAALK